MESETRNTGIMVAVVITAIIIVLLVIFLRPKETTVKEIVKEDQEAVFTIEEKVSNLSSRVKSLEETLGYLNGFETDIKQRLQNLENELEQNKTELRGLKSNFTTIIVFAVLILVFLVVFIVGTLIKNNKISLSKLKDKVKPDKKHNDDDEILNDYGWTTVEGNQPSEKQKDEFNNNDDDDDNLIKEEESEENEDYEHNHGSYDELSKKEKKSLLNDSFEPKEEDDE